jgi:signal transduction histidine kinase/DNA-binding response OmpR family regulator
MSEIKSKPKVLLVEDEATQAFVIQEILTEMKDAPFELEWFDRLLPGLERLDEGGIDVILLDLGLPDSGRLDTFTRVYTKAPEVPIVVFTGLDDEEVAVQTVRKGAQDYLIKGQVKGNMLVRALQYAIERKQVEKERTRFTNQLQTAADVAEQISTILDIDRLLHETVTMLQAHFDLYHVHIYLLDETTRSLVVHAGSGEVGQTLRERGHSIPLDREHSLVARAARSRKVVSAVDTCIEPDFMSNSLLPETCSEVAVPLIVGDQVLGVLDVQDDQVERFSQSDIDTLSTLSGQIATALRNARLFAETQKTAEQLREVEHLKSEFLIDMSHQLRTSLNSIVGYADIMLMGINGPLGPETLEDAQAIYDLSQRMLRPINSINDVLDLIKLEAGLLTLDLEQIQIKSLLDGIRTNNTKLLADKEKPVEMIVEIEEGLPPIEADPLRLNQILINLVYNAVQFTNKGAITLRAFADPSPSEWICIEVEDTGIGIGEDDLETMFEKPQKANNSLARHFQGADLYLPIARHLVQMHGGTIDVHSQPNQGSTFTVRLPIQHRVTQTAF